MKGDFSRYTFDPKKHYSQVLMQQGRVQVDADWNEQQAIHQHRIETETKDVIGLCGVPHLENGFGLRLLVDLRNVYFVDSRRGWVIGDGGTILATHNGGKSWVLQPSGVTVTLWDIYFLSPQLGWIVGDDGLILKTSNGGKQWVQLTTNATQNLSGIHFISPQRGWAVGEDGVILTTFDGGQTWVGQNSTVNFRLEGGVFFVNERVGWVAGNSNQILQTTDGGQTWNVIRVGGESSPGFRGGLYFADENQGWLVGESSIYATGDGGRTWTQQFSDTNEYLWAVSFSSTQQGWVTGNNGLILATVDGGQTWTRQSSGISSQISGIAAVSSQQAWAVSREGTILTTSNGGQTSWIPQSQPQDIVIAPGRIYVDGILCETEGCLFSQQPNYPNALLPGEAGYYLIYLDVWQRHLTYLDDSLMREVALGGSDTTTRLQTVWQVKLLPIAVSISRNSVQDILSRLELIKNDLSSLLNQPEQSGGVREVVTSLLDAIVAAVNTLNGQPSVTQQQMAAIFKELDAGLKQLERYAQLAEQGAGTFPGSETVESIRGQYDKLIGEAVANSPPHCTSSFAEWDTLVAPSTGQLNVRTQPPEDTDNPCLIPLSAGYQRLENQLYRVEIHRKGNLGEATFKWSRDNGSVVTAITEIDGQRVMVADLGRDEVLGFANGQWIETSDNNSELKGQPGQLAQIVSIDSSTQSIVLNIPVADIDLDKHPKLRRWDSVGEIPVEIPVDNDGWIHLEDGIEIQFSEGTYRTGDYWLIPARTATGEVEWPPYKIPNTNPIPQSPSGIAHHYCRLAIVEIEDWGEEGTGIRIREDCRRFFRPLTSPLAMHITEISWVHGSVLPLNNFLNQGLIIELDTVADLNSITPATLVVTMEVPFAIGGRDSAPTSRNAPDLTFILDGDNITRSGRSIRWQPVREQVLQIINFAETSFDSDRTRGPNQYLVRVVLKGHKVWSASASPRLYLDGQVFGQPPSSSGSEPALLFPSGDGARASDFESWFYLAKPIELIALSIDFPKQVSAGGSIRATVSLSGPAPAGGVEVNLRITAPTTGTPVSFPASVSVPANAASVGFSITAQNVSIDTSVTLQASLGDKTETDSLTVISLPNLERVTVVPNQVTGGNVATGTVFLSKAAPPGGAVVNLSSSSPLASLPTPMVTVPGGATQANFQILTPDLSPVADPGGGTVTISATYRSTTQSAQLGVTYLI
jgi:photosystem II stability/assembly factor-like uncharacterized protein